MFKQKLDPFVESFANLGGVAWRHVPISDENNIEMGSLAGIKNFKAIERVYHNLLNVTILRSNCAKAFGFRLLLFFCNEK